MKRPTQSTQPEMDMEVAGRLLSNVFDACNYEHNTVPIEVLSSYGNYRKERYGIQKGLLIALMVLFLLLPFLFIAPSLTLEPMEDNGRLRLTDSTFLPVQRVTATLNGKSLPVYEESAHAYILQPTENGTLEVTMTLLNRQTSVVSCEVTDVDDELPVLRSSELEDGILRLYCEDTLSGIDAEHIRLTDSDGNTLSGFAWDEEAGCVILPYPDEVVRLYLPDKAGNTLQLLLTPQ